MRRLLTAAFTLALAAGLVLPTTAGFAHGDVKDHKDIVIKVLDEAFAKGNVGYLKDVTSTDYKQVNPSGEYNLAGVQLVVGGFKSAMPDFKATPLLVIAEGDWVATRIVYSGTFTKPLQLPTQKIEPNNKVIMWTANGLTHFNADDKIDQDWLMYDNLAVFTQLGIIPPQPNMPPMAEMKMPETLTPMELSADLVKGNKQGLMDIIETAFNKGDLSLIDQRFASTFVDHETALPDGDTTAFKGTVSAQRTALPDLKATLDAILCEANYCAFRLTITGTFKNDFVVGPLSLKATGKPVTYAVQGVARYDDKGMIAEQWIEGDSLTFFKQFGAM